MNELERLQEALIQEVPLQKKKIAEALAMLDENARYTLLKYVRLRMEYGETIESLAEAYHFIVNETNKEQLYYLRNNRKYRKSQTKEVLQSVYADSDYMKKYMTGLAISIFIWPQHKRLYDFFVKHISDEVKTVENNWNYLEIGAGHGLFASYALTLSESYSRYDFVDISETGINLTKEMLANMCENSLLSFYCDDIMNYMSECTYHFICAGEVIEAVENPKAFLEHCHSLLDADGSLFLSTPINSAVPDSIYLFGSIKNIEELFTETGFKILDYTYIPHEKYSLKTCEERGLPINVGYILKKQDNIIE